MRHEDVIESAVGLGLFHHVHVDRSLDDTQQRGVTLGRRTTAADILFAKGVAALAMAHDLQCEIETVGQAPGACTVSLHEVIRHALRRFRPDARQTAQGLDQRIQAGGIQNAPRQPFRTGASCRAAN